MAVPDIYISVDIEADGPIPGPYSMLAFGLAVAGRYDGTVFHSVDPTERTFYRTLQPISDNFDPEAVAVSGLNRDDLIRAGTSPREALLEAKRWIIDSARDHRPVLVGYPLVYDWQFFYWYLQSYAPPSPVDFSAGLDMKTMYQQKARVPLSEAGKDDLPPFLRSERPHTHNALDDAIEQADIFVKLFTWNP